MNHELKNIGWRKFPTGEARHHWRTRGHTDMTMSACSLIRKKSDLEIDDTLPACPHCEAWLDLYLVDDPAPPQI